MSYAEFSPSPPPDWWLRRWVSIVVFLGMWMWDPDPAPWVWVLP